MLRSHFRRIPLRGARLRRRRRSSDISRYRFGLARRACGDGEGAFRPDGRRFARQLRRIRTGRGIRGRAGSSRPRISRTCRSSCRCAYPQRILADVRRRPGFRNACRCGRPGCRFLEKHRSARRDRVGRRRRHGGRCGNLPHHRARRCGRRSILRGEGQCLRPQRCVRTPGVSASRRIARPGHGKRPWVAVSVRCERLGAFRLAEKRRRLDALRSEDLRSRYRLESSYVERPGVLVPLRCRRAHADRMAEGRREVVSALRFRPHAQGLAEGRRFLVSHGRCRRCHGYGLDQGRR